MKSDIRSLKFTFEVSFHNLTNFNILVLKRVLNTGYWH